MKLTALSRMYEVAYWVMVLIVPRSFTRNGE